MDFDLDDPLADILSGGSDDSFFDDDVMGKKKTLNKSTPLSEKKKSSLFDLDDDPKPASNLKTDKNKTNLFNLDDDPKPTVLNKPVDYSNKDVDQKPAPLKTSFSKDSITVKDPLKTPLKTKDTSLEFDQTTPKEKVANLQRFDSFNRTVTPKSDLFIKQSEKQKSSISMLDDILGGPVGKFSSTQIKPPKASKSQEFDFETLLGNEPPIEPKKTIAPATAPSKISNQLESKPELSTKSGKSVPKTSKSNDDWLGIFKEKDDMATNVTEDTGMPAWLVGKDSKTKNTNLKTKDSVNPPKPIRKESLTNVQLTDDKTKQKVETDAGYTETKNLENIPQKNEPVVASTVPTILTASNEDITQEGAALYMQQQESQLMVALQLKAQEEKLASMQLRQQESKKIQQQATIAHHSQLNAMLEKQAAHRHQMQTIIMSHQERINERIKSLLGTSNLDSGEDGYNIDVDIAKSSEVSKESPHVKERKQLLQLVQTLQENHDKEIDLMETSYRRQLAFTDASLNQSEERIKDEMAKLIKHYTEKIEWLEEQQRSYRLHIEENIKCMTDQHAQELRDVRGSHLESVKMLQEQHAVLIKNIKNAVHEEHVLIQDSTTFSKNLIELIADVKESKSHCQQLVEEVHSQHERSTQERSASMKIREAQVNEMLQHLTKEKEHFEKEKFESRETVKLLETRLKQMSQSMEEEIGVLKQKRMEFEFEKATFSKQTEFAKNILKKQEEEIKMIKEDIQKEYEDKMAKIDEDRSKSQKGAAVIAKERITTENLRQELEKLKAELQSQMEEVSEDRSRVTLEKHQLHMEEQRIVAKSRDLDLLARSALEKQSQADRKLSEAEYVQRKFEDRVRRLQENVISLNSREKIIARDKVALSRERLGLHNERRQLESRQQCSLCRSINQTQFPYGNASATQYEPLANFKSEYLSMGVSRDYGVASDANAMEREMSNLLGADHSLRGRADNGNTDGGNVLEPLNMAVVDPKLLLLRLDVQQVINNLNEKSDVGQTGDQQADVVLPNRRPTS